MLPGSDSLRDWTDSLPSLWKSVPVRGVWVKTAAQPAGVLPAGSFTYISFAGKVRASTLWKQHTISESSHEHSFGLLDFLKQTLQLDFESCHLTIANILGISCPKYVGVTKTKSWFLLPRDLSFLVWFAAAPTDGHMAIQNWCLCTILCNTEGDPVDDRP